MSSPPPKSMRFLRLERGWYGAELARRMGVSSARVSRWELGMDRPSPPQIPKLAVLFGIPAADVIAAIEQSMRDGAVRAAEKEKEAAAKEE